MTLTACLAIWLLALAWATGCLDSIFTWTVDLATGIVATVATWGRATKRHAVHSPSPRVDGPISRRGVSYEQSGPALALQMVGDEFDQIQFDWKA
jgi:hypothetical protein